MKIRVRVSKISKKLKKKLGLMKTMNGSVVLKVLTSVERTNGELGLINERRLPPTVLVLMVAKNWYELYENEVSS